MWKSQGCMVVNGVLREVPRPKSEGAADSKGFWPRDFLRNSIPYDTPKAFPHTFILSSSRSSKEGFIFSMVSLGPPLENGDGMKPSPLVELNADIVVRDVKRMARN